MTAALEAKRSERRLGRRAFASRRATLRSVASSEDDTAPDGDRRSPAGAVPMLLSRGAGSVVSGGDNLESIHEFEHQLHVPAPFPRSEWSHSPSCPNYRRVRKRTADAIGIADGGPRRIRCSGPRVLRAGRCARASTPHTRRPSHGARDRSPRHGRSPPDLPQLNPPLAPPPARRGRAGGAIPRPRLLISRGMRTPRPLPAPR
jgi:hypothetical protein